MNIKWENTNYLIRHSEKRYGELSVLKRPLPNRASNPTSTTARNWIK